VTYELLAARPIDQGVGQCLSLHDHDKERHARVEISPGRATSQRQWIFELSQDILSTLCTGRSGSTEATYGISDDSEIMRLVV
jgi:hypothetical protein